jgi:membrane-associated phospholipid phosphatase
MDFLAKFFLLFGNNAILMPLIFTGLILRQRHFLIPTFLLLFTMILSATLKLVFAVPYSPELVQKLGKEGFSFPSGHMQSTIVFYGLSPSLQI